MDDTEKIQVSAPTFRGISLASRRGVYMLEKMAVLTALDNWGEHEAAIWLSAHWAEHERVWPERGIMAYSIDGGPEATAPGVTPASPGHTSLEEAEAAGHHQGDPPKDPPEG